MLWFAVNRSFASADAAIAAAPPESVTDVLQGLRRLSHALDGVSADDLAATMATVHALLARLGELAKTLELIARLKVRLDGDVRTAAAS